MKSNNLQISSEFLAVRVLKRQGDKMKLSRNQLAMANTLRMRAADHLVEAWRARRDLEAWRLPWFDAFELSAFIRQHLEAARRARRAEMALRNPVEF